MVYVFLNLDQVWLLIGTLFSFDQSCGLTDLSISKDFPGSTFILIKAYRRHILQKHNKIPLSCGYFAFSNKHSQSPVSLCITFSLLLRTSLAGIGHRRCHHRYSHYSPHHCILQEVEEEETKGAGREWGGATQREKRPHCVVRKRQRERQRGIAHSFSRPPSNSGGIRPCGLFLLDASLSSFLFSCSLWIPDLDEWWAAFT